MSFSEERFAGIKWMNIENVFFSNWFVLLLFENVSFL